MKINQNIKRFSTISFLMVICLFCINTIPNPSNAPRRSTTTWELSKYREQLADTGYVLRDVKRNPIEIVISDGMTSADILAWNDSMKAHGGGRMLFSSGVHLIDTTIYFGPNCQYIGLTADDTDKQSMGKAILRLNPIWDGARRRMDLFAPDPKYLNTATVNPYTGAVGLGFIDNVKISNLRLEIATSSQPVQPGTSGRAWQSACMAGVRFAGVTDSEISNCDINNFLFGIIVTANECDDLFFIGDNDWTTKAWSNKIFGNQITNTGYTSTSNGIQDWFTGVVGEPCARDTMLKYAGAGISLIVANSIECHNNDAAFTGGPELFIPLISKANIFSNNFETSINADTLNPFAIIGFYSPGYDSTHPLVHSEFDSCAIYDIDNTWNISQRGARGVTFANNRFESEDLPHHNNLYIGWNAKNTEVYGNIFSKQSGNIETNHRLVVQDFGQSTIWGVNGWPTDGRQENWQPGEKALYHTLYSQPNGGTVELGPYTYFINFATTDIGPVGGGDFFNIPSNVTIKGVPGKTIIKLDATGNLQGAQADAADSLSIFRWDSHRGVFNVAGDSNVVIQDIIFDGNFSFGDSARLIGTPANTLDQRFKGLVIGFNTGELVTKNVTIKNCTFKNFVHCLEITNDGKFENINIVNNTFEPQVLWNLALGTTAIKLDALTAVGDTAKGITFKDNICIDYGIKNIVTATSITSGRWPEEINKVGNIFNSLIENNYLDVKVLTGVNRADTSFSYNGFSSFDIGSEWDVVWQPFAVILHTDFTGNVGGWVKMNADLAYTVPFNSELTSATVAVDDTSSNFTLELYKEAGIKHAAAPTLSDSVFTMTMNQANSSVSYGAPTTSVLAWDLYSTRNFSPKQITFLAGDQIKPFVRLASGEYANGLTLTLRFRKR